MTLSDLSYGSHSLSVRQTDYFNNVSDVATTSSWTVQQFGSTAATLDSGSSTVAKPTLIKGSGYSLTNVVGSSPAVAFQWQRCSVLDLATSCYDITGSVGSDGAWWGTRDADIGYQLRLKTSWSTVQGTITAFSQLTGVIQPASTGAPSLSTASPRKSVSVSASFGAWSGYIAGVSTVTFTWSACPGLTAEGCVQRQTGTGQAYKPATSDLGQYLRLVAKITTRGQIAYSTPVVATNPVTS
jgi:hypothetical protein